MANETHIQYAPAWVPEPNGRGTWGILYSCTFTLSICVWSAIHLNIPPKGESESLQWWRKTKWVFIAIFAPEAVLYSSWQQFYLAWRFCMEVQNKCRNHHKITRVDPRFAPEIWIDRFLAFIERKLRRSGDDNSGEKKSSRGEKDPPRSTFRGYPSDWHDLPEDVRQELKPFSMTYGFYVIMGGFVVNTSDIYDHERAQWFTVTPRGVTEFAKTMTWPEFKQHFSVDLDQIKDKSKADSLTKVLVIMQVLWAALNSLSRVTLGYPITVLEVHTLVHAACAMMMYAFWFKKPLDIRDPTQVKTSSFRDKLALMMVRDSRSAFSPAVDFKLPTRWSRDVGYSYNFPAERAANEATFLSFDTSKIALDEEMEARSYDPGFTYEKYSIISQLPDTVPDEADSSDDDSDSESSDNGTSELNRIQSDVFRSDSESEIDWVAKQSDFETSLGTAFQTRQSMSIPFQMPNAGICRGPPNITVKPPLKGRIHHYWYKLVPPTEPVPTVTTLITGEFLDCGIGPASLITSRSRSMRQREYESYIRWVHDYTPWMTGLKSLLDKYVAPHQTELVEVDERLKPFLAIPQRQWRGARKSSQKVPPRRKHIYCHKISASLSAKDVTRWTRAGNAFRAELLAQKKVDTTKSESEKEIASSPTSSDEGLNNTTTTTETSDTRAVEKTSEIQQPKLKTLWKEDESDGSAIFTSSWFCYRSGNIDFDALMELSGSDAGRFAAMYIAMTYVSSIYAGIHLALWNHDFPTRAESILWKISGITLGIWAPLFVAANTIFWIYMAAWPYQELAEFFKHNVRCKACRGWIEKRWKAIRPYLQSLLLPLRKARKQLAEAFDRGTTKLEEMYQASKPNKGPIYWVIQSIRYLFLSIVFFFAWGVFLIPICAAAAAIVLLYCFARVYIVTESFLSLRRVPVGVYQDVSWAQYIPHL